MKKLINDLKEFNKAFKIQTGASAELRYKLMEEENKEYYEACLQNNWPEIADALGDQLYILIGTIINHGLEDVIEDVFKEIHRSNMSKLGADGLPIVNGINVKDASRPVGKILKGPNYTDPNVEGILNGTYKPVKRYIKLHEA